MKSNCSFKIIALSRRMRKMKIILKNHLLLIFIFLAVMQWNDVCSGQISPDMTAPAFTLKDLGGKTYDLSQMTKQPMTILYFFDSESKPSQEGLLSLNRLAKQYKEADLAVWAITLSSKENVKTFVNSTGLAFPILLDNSGVSDLYQAQMILPTVCTIGPGLKILDYFQGGGRNTETMLVRLAERKLQQRQTKIAKAISSEIINKNPDNVKAQTVSGYASLKDGNFTEAEKFFKTLSQKGSKGEVLGKEGLAATYAKKGEPEKALRLVEEIEQKAPERGYLHVIKGDLLYAQGKKKDAEIEYEKANKKEEAEPYLIAEGYNKRGRLYADAGQYEDARKLYDQAQTIDPLNVVNTTNKAISYEKEGRYDKAVESYNQALSIDRNDTFAVVLAKKAQEMLDIQKDTNRSKRIDQMVKDLAERYRSEKEIKPEIKDSWTSGPMVLTFVDFQEKGGLSERDGFSTVLLTQLGDLLNSSGRVKVVERVLMERLLEELNLGSSDLANPETALKLGKLLAAKLIGVGSIYFLPQETMLSLRLIDTETSAIQSVLTKKLSSKDLMENEFFVLNRDILKTVISKYPLRGYIVKSTGDKFIINIGLNQGLVMGTKLDVLDEQEPIEYKGKTLRSTPKSVGQIEVVQVEPDMSYVKVTNQDRSFKTDDIVQEKIDESALK